MSNETEAKNIMRTRSSEIEDLGQNIQDLLKNSAIGVIDDETLERSQYIPARLRMTYTYIRIYLKNTLKTDSKRERLDSIRMMIMNQLRMPETVAKNEIELKKYRELSQLVFTDKKAEEDFKKFIDERFGPYAEELAERKIKIWDNIFLQMGKADEEISHIASGREKIRYGVDSDPVEF